MTRDEMKELKGLAASMGLYDDKNPCKRAVILGKAIQALEQQTCEDCISREAVLENIKGLKKSPWFNDDIPGVKIVRKEAVEIIEDLCIKNLPSVNHAEKQELCEDAVSRQAVKDKLLKLCNELEGIFADIRMKEVDDCVCGLCEYDCDHGIDGSAFECPGFETDECFKLADEIRYEWQNTKDLPPVNPQPICEEREKGECPYYAG